MVIGVFMVHKHALNKTRDVFKSSLYNQITMKLICSARTN